MQDLQGRTAFVTGGANGIGFALARAFINEGMRAGIPDQTARERTVTLYLDKQAFKSALDISSEDDIYIFLVDRNGNIYWQTRGEYTQEKGIELRQSILELKQ